MKACPLCGIDAEETDKKCGGCGYRFYGANAEANDEDLLISSEASPASQRPDGGAPMIVGWLCFAVSLILAVVSFNVGPEAWRVSAAENGSTYALSDVADAYPDLINGTYQIGKQREALPTNIAVFARAILMDGKSGRFVCKDGRKPGLVGYGKRAIIGYDLDPDIAEMIDVPVTGFVGK